MSLNKRRNYAAPLLFFIIISIVHRVVFLPLFWFLYQIDEVGLMKPPPYIKVFLSLSICARYASWKLMIVFSLCSTMTTTTKFNNETRPSTYIYNKLPAWNICQVFLLFKRSPPPISFFFLLLSIIYSVCALLASMSLMFVFFFFTTCG